VFGTNGNGYPVNVKSVLNIAGSKYYSDLTTIAPSSWAIPVGAFLFAPQSLMRWTHSHIARFGNGTIDFGLNIQPVLPGSVALDPPSSIFKVYAINLRFSIVPERRVASAFRGLTTLAGGWRALTLNNPLTDVTAAWSKVSGHNYTVIASIPIGGGA